MKFKFIFVGLVIILIVVVLVIFYKNKSLNKVGNISKQKNISTLDQQLQDFLNKEGDYTKEKMAEMAIWGSQFSYIDGNGTDLGILRIFNERSDEQDKYVAVYGNLYDVSRNENNDIVLTMGFDGKDGNRFNTNLMILSNAYDFDGNGDGFVFSFSTEEGLHLDDKHVRQFLATTSDEIFNYLIGLKGKKIVVDIPAKKADLNGKSGGSKIFWEGANGKLLYTYNLINRLANNGIDTSMIGSSGKDITLIDSSDDLDTINSETIPIIIKISYRR